MQLQSEFLPGSTIEIVVDVGSIKIEAEEKVIVARAPGAGDDSGYDFQFSTDLWPAHFGGIKHRPTVHHGMPWKVKMQVEDFVEVQMGEGPNAEPYTGFSIVGGGTILVRGTALTNLQKYELMKRREPTLMEKAQEALSVRRSLQGA